MFAGVGEAEVAGGERGAEGEELVEGGEGCGEGDGEWYCWKRRLVVGQGRWRKGGWKGGGLTFA